MTTTIRMVVEAYFLTVCVWVSPHACVQSLWTRSYPINCFGEFHQTYNFGAVRDKDKLIRFW